MSKFGGENLYFWGSLYFLMQDANSSLNLCFSLSCPHSTRPGTGIHDQHHFLEPMRIWGCLLPLSYALRLPDFHGSCLVCSEFLPCRGVRCPIYSSDLFTVIWSSTTGVTQLGFFLRLLLSTLLVEHTLVPFVLNFMHKVKQNNASGFFCLVGFCWGFIFFFCLNSTQSLVLGPVTEMLTG